MEDTLGKFKSTIGGSLTFKCPKQVLRKIDKQLIGKTGYRLSVRYPLHKRIRKYYDSILNTRASEYSLH